MNEDWRRVCQMKQCGWFRWRKIGFKLTAKLLDCKVFCPLPKHVFPQGFPEMEHILILRIHSWLSSLVDDLSEDFSTICSCVIRLNQLYKLFRPYRESQHLWEVLPCKTYVWFGPVCHAYSVPDFWLLSLGRTCAILAGSQSPLHLRWSR